MKKALAVLLLTWSLDAQTVFTLGTNFAPWMNDGNAGWGPLSGRLKGSIDACGGGGEIYLAARGDDDTVLISRRSDGGWTPWESVGGPAASDVSIVCTGGSARVFVRRPDRALWTRAVDPGEAWQPLGGRFDGSPEATASSRGVIDVVVRGETGGVWHIRYIDGSWLRWHSLGGNPASDPTIASMSDTRTEIVFRTADGTLRHGTFAERVTWHTVPNAIVRGSPDAHSLGDGRLDLVARAGSSDAIVIGTFDGTAWTPFRSLGGSSPHDPAVIAAANSSPAAARRRGRYVLHVTGFTVNNQTYDDPLNLDGWADEVFYSPDEFTLGADGAFELGASVRTSVYGQATSSGVVQAGTARDEGGLQNGDSHPPPGETLGALSSVALELEEGRSAVLLVPTLWEHDLPQELFLTYAREIARRRDAVNVVAPGILASVRTPGNLSRFIRDGEDFALGEVVRWPGAQGPNTYPIGSVPGSGGMAFTPKVIVLTYETAEHIVSHRFPRPVATRTPAGTVTVTDQIGELGQFAIRYRDQGVGFSGDYTIYFQLVRD
jgi:hypothetical protein